MKGLWKKEIWIGREVASERENERQSVLIDESGKKASRRGKNMAENKKKKKKGASKSKGQTRISEFGKVRSIYDISSGKWWFLQWKSVYYPSMYPITLTERTISQGQRAEINGLKYRASIPD